MTKDIEKLAKVGEDSLDTRLHTASGQVLAVSQYINHFQDIRNATPGSLLNFKREFSSVLRHYGWVRDIVISCGLDPKKYDDRIAQQMRDAKKRLKHYWKKLSSVA